MKKKNILIALIVFFSVILFLYSIFLFSYFNIGPDRLMPNKCLLTSGLSCHAKMTTIGITMRIINSLGQDIQNIKLAFAKCPDEDGIASGPVTLANGESGNYTIICTNVLRGAKILTDMTFNYTSADNQKTQSVTGVLNHNIENPILSFSERFKKIFIPYIPILISLGLVIIIIVLSILPILLHKENLKNKKKK